MSIVYTSHMHCNTLQHTATHGYTLLHAALQHTATHCNTRAYIKGLFRILHSVGQQQKKNCCRRNLIANKNSFVGRKNFVVERKLLRFFCKREIFFVWKSLMFEKNLRGKTPRYRILRKKFAAKMSVTYVAILLYVYMHIYVYTYIDTHIYIYPYSPPLPLRILPQMSVVYYGVATISRLLKIIGFFWKRAP